MLQIHLPVTGFRQSMPERRVILKQIRRHSAMDWRNPVPWTVTGRIRQCLVGFFCNVADSLPCDWVPAVHAGTTGFAELKAFLEELGYE